MASGRVLITMLALSAIFAISFQIFKPMNEAGIEERSVQPDSVSEGLEAETMNEAAGTSANTTTVANCLSLKTEIEPFNLLMALVESNYAVADFTTLNIEEIKNCLSLLETLHQRVRICKHHVENCIFLNTTADFGAKH